MIDPKGVMELCVSISGLLAVALGCLVLIRVVGDEGRPTRRCAFGVALILIGVLGVARGDIYSDPLSIRMENDSDQSIHFVLAIDGEVVVDDNMAPERYWLDSSDTLHAWYYDDELEAEKAYRITIWIDGGEGIEYPALVYLGSAASMRLNPDMTMTFWLDGSILEAGE